MLLRQFVVIQKLLDWVNSLRNLLTIISGYFFAYNWNFLIFFDIFHKSISFCSIEWNVHQKGITKMPALRNLLDVLSWPYVGYSRADLNRLFGSFINPWERFSLRHVRSAMGTSAPPLFSNCLISVEFIISLNTLPSLHSRILSDR